ncbi:MAG: PVC-type heme-binding CxxCH protein [Verrucomicrobiota bacterium]
MLASIALAGALLIGRVAPAAEHPGGVGPEAALRDVQNLKPAAGLAVTLFASEPMVRNPANMDVDARGRVWVTEGANYRLWQKWGKLRPAGDRIVILEDTDGDGRADKETVFYQGNDVNTALGVCVLGERVIVSSSPNVFIFTDENGDGRADKKELLFTGIQGVDNDHGVHAVVFGPDGKLYFNFGNASGELHRPDGTVVKDKENNPVVAAGRPFRQGMTFRCNLDGSEVEVLGHNFRNPYEVAVDSFGTVWQSDNDDDGNFGVRINYVMAHGNFGYTDEMTGASWGIGWKKARDAGKPDSQKVFYEWHQFDPGVVPNLLHTGAGSPTGLCIYEGTLLPEPFQNQIVHCDAGPRLVRAYRVSADGAGYQASITNLLTSTDEWFRPSDVCVAPDGALYIADWNDAGVGGHYMADQKLETMTGRVYRLAPTGHKPSVPTLDLTTPAGCAAALQSPNQATRYLAWTKLLSFKDAAEPELTRLWRDNRPRMRARALHLLASLPARGKEYLDAAIKDPDPDIRIAALRIAQAQKVDVIPYIRATASDASPQVRRECALALRHSASPAAAPLWASLAQQHTAGDRWYLEALGIGADQQWDSFLSAWIAVGQPTWDSAAGRDIVWRSRAKQTAGLLAKVVQNPSVSASDRERLMRAFDFLQGPEKDAALIEVLTSATK